MSDKPQTIEGYFERLAPERREALTTLRSVVEEMAPEAVETMRYGMPTYEQDGEVLCALASQKRHMSLYMDVDLVEQHREELAGLDVGKSCIRFRSLDGLPLDTVRAILNETGARRRRQQ